MVDTDLLRETLEEFFQSADGLELLTQECFHDSHDMPNVELKHFEFDEETNTATFTVISEGTGLDLYEDGDRGVAGEVDDDSPGACRYEFELVVEDQKIDLDKLVCKEAAVINTVGDLRPA